MRAMYLAANELSFSLDDSNGCRVAFTGRSCENHDCYRTCRTTNLVELDRPCAISCMARQVSSPTQRIRILILLLVFTRRTEANLITATTCNWLAPFVEISACSPPSQHRARMAIWTSRRCAPS